MDITGPFDAVLVPDRRSFLKLGLAAGAALAAGGGLLSFAGRDAAADRATVLAAVVPAVLGDALPGGPTAPGAGAGTAAGSDAAAGAGPRSMRAQAIARTVQAVETAIAGLSPAAQAELSQLFLLLASAPGRTLLAGLGNPWAQATTDEVSAFLGRWRHHRLAMLRSGYQALHDLVAGAWYAMPQAWGPIGYPGPPRI